MKPGCLPLLLLMAILALLAAVARADDHPVQINPELAGAWNLPAAKWNGSAVLMCHGFADDMDAVGDSAKHLAAALADAGIASLRINFRGEGDRKRTDIESTLFTRIEDAEAAYAFLIKEPGVQTAHVGIYGVSLGATTAIETAAKHPEWFRTMALWSSPSGDQDKMMNSSPTAQKALRDGEASDTVPGWKTITTHRAFYESFRGVDLNRSLAKYPGAFLSVRGTADFLPIAESDFLKIVKGQTAEALLIGGASHIFDMFQPETGHAARAQAYTLDWFVRTL